MQPGTVTGLIGPNGAGKTTLFNVISGLQAPDRGTVHLFDTDVTAMKPHRRARLGLARTFQRLELFGSLTAGENVQVGLESTVKWWEWRHLRRAVPWRREPAGRRPTAPDGGRGPARARVAGRRPPATGCSRGSGSAGSGDEQSAAMSTGLARMVELARALAIGPKLLLLDEPGSGLDEAESKALGDLLAKLAAGGMAVLLVEHDMELVMRICDHIYVLDFGDIIASGTPDEIRNDPMVQAAYLGEVATGRRPAEARSARPRTATGTGAVTDVTAARPAASPPAGPPAPARASSSTGVRAAYGRIEVLHGVDLVVPAGQRVRPARAQRGRQVDAAQGDQRPHAADRRARCSSATSRWARRPPRSWPGAACAPCPRAGASSPT